VVGAVAILCGALVLFGMLRSRRMPVVAALFFASTILAGVLLPQASVAPSLPAVVVAAVVVAVALVARYVGDLAGHWRWIYVIAMLVILYLEVQVALVEAFIGLPALLLMLPLAAEPPYVQLQLVLISVFVALCAAALRMFRPPGGAPA
jgi:hypothetical protein